MKLSMKIPARPRSRDIAPIIQRQWLQHLGIEVILSEVEETVWQQDLTFKRYGHVIEESWSAFCEDPSDFLTLLWTLAFRGNHLDRRRALIAISPQLTDFPTRQSGSKRLLLVRCSSLKRCR